MPTPSAEKLCGSSPHTRGARPDPHRDPRGSGIIPAYAGSTPTPNFTRLVPPDHPRIRGEHPSCSRSSTPTVGSSPHTRGAQKVFVTDPVDGGIIPAYAGSTGGAGSRRRLHGDHPRIRGEHGAAQDACDGGEGSSPHTRGAHRLALHELALERIIPAYAGSTPAGPPRAGAGKDHPRIRGEHQFNFACDTQLVGSSPHTRGAPPGWRAPPARRWDHPRIRGEHCHRGGLYFGSPLDHPRIRGEHSRPSTITISGPGSSPHTRGAPATSDSQPSPARIIPAYAGSTHWPR